MRFVASGFGVVLFALGVCLWFLVVWSWWLVVCVDWLFGDDCGVGLCGLCVADCVCLVGF